MKTLAIFLLVCSFAIFGFAAEEEDFPVESFDEQVPDESNEDSEEDELELADESTPLHQMMPSQDAFVVDGGVDAEHISTGARLVFAEDDVIEQTNQMAEDESNDPAAEALISLRESGKKTPKKGQIIEVSPFMFTDKGGSVKALRISLNNLLKQSKAKKWVCFEWFYSDIDRALFLGENDFSICLQEHFPQLKARRLTRLQWSMIRRMMGKPRRCSAAFFAEERQALAMKRKKIRYLLHRKSSDIPDFKSFKELPDEIALPIVIGTPVTARLREPQDGLFSGQVDAVDIQDNTYRITFDREGLGTRSVPDYEVARNEQQETIPLSSLIVKDRQRPAVSTISPPRISPALPSYEDSFKGTSSNFNASPARMKLEEALKNVESGATYGGFPVKFLVLATRLSKILSVKKKCVERLREMNSSAERMESYGEAFSKDFQKKYASVVLELDRINKDLSICLEGVQQYCQELSPGNWASAFDEPTSMPAKCDREARLLVETSERNVRSSHLKDLVCNLTSLLLQIKFFADENLQSFELAAINQTTEKIKASLDPRNASSFVDKVEVHVAHIQNGLSHGGSLPAFSNGLQNLTLI
eukprot:gene17933-19722_t